MPASNVIKQHFLFRGTEFILDTVEDIKKTIENDKKEVNKILKITTTPVPPQGGGQPKPPKPPKPAVDPLESKPITTDVTGKIELKDGVGSKKVVAITSDHNKDITAKLSDIVSDPAGTNDFVKISTSGNKITVEQTKNIKGSAKLDIAYKTDKQKLSLVIECAKK